MTGDDDDDDDDDILIGDGTTRPSLKPPPLATQCGADEHRLIAAICMCCIGYAGQ